MSGPNRDSEYRSMCQGLQVDLCALLRAKGPLSTVDICAVMAIPSLTLSKVLRGSRSFIITSAPKTNKGVSRIVSLHPDLLTGPV